MKNRFIILGIIIFSCIEIAGQSLGQVGINIDTPRATLHVAGNLRIDTVPTINPKEPFSFLGIDLQGNVIRQNIGEISLPIICGENVYAGDAVALGDGMTGYQSINQGVSTGNISVFLGSWIAQTFQTSSIAKGIKAVSFFTSSGQTSFTVSIQEISHGIPSGIDIGTTSYHHAGTTTSFFTFVFDPPVMVLPNHTYVMIVKFVRNNGAIKVDYANNNPYLLGDRLQTSDSGKTWTSFPSEDIRFKIFETQTIPGLLYRAASHENTLAPEFFSGPSISTAPSDFVDKNDNFIGFVHNDAATSTLGHVVQGPVYSGLSGLRPGALYKIDSIPGKIIQALPSSVRNIGFALSDTTLLLK